jgi:hypothetical protein
MLGGVVGWVLMLVLVVGVVVAGMQKGLIDQVCTMRGSCEIIHTLLLTNPHQDMVVDTLKVTVRIAGESAGALYTMAREAMGKPGHSQNQDYSLVNMDGDASGIGDRARGASNEGTGSSGENGGGAASLFGGRGGGGGGGLVAAAAAAVVAAAAQLPSSVGAGAVRLHRRQQSSRRLQQAMCRRCSLQRVSLRRSMATPTCSEFDYLLLSGRGSGRPQILTRNICGRGELRPLGVV